MGFSVSGLISGIDTASIVDSLMKLESGARNLVEDRQTVVEDKRLAVMDLSALMVSLKVRLASVRATRGVSTVSASSSNSSILSATTSVGASAGTHQFTVARLAVTQQFLGTGVASKTSILGTGTLTLRDGAARLTSDTALSTLNGQDGVRLGKIRITDRSGISEIVDLSNAVTMGDVLEAINAAEDIGVEASVSNGKLVLTDTTGLTSSNLIVTEVGSTHTAEDLGVKSSVAANTLTGTNLVSVNADTSLSLLNDGLGVRQSGGNDFTVTLRDGSSFTVDLGSAETLGDAVDAINAASQAHSNPGAVVAAINDDGDGLKLTDSSVGGSLTVTALGGSRAAQDLGLLGTDTAGDGVIQGRALLGDLQSVLLNTLNGGDGVARGRISITDRAGTASTVDLRGADTVQDVIDAINAASANVTASLNEAGTGIVVTDNTGQSGNLVIADLDGTTTAADLGLVVNSAVSEVSSGDLQRQVVNEATLLSSLNHGDGVPRGKFTITDSSGATATIDLTQGDETTLQDVIDEINNNPTINVTARINDAGDGLVIEDNAAGGNLLTIADVSGTAAQSLGLAGTAASGTTFIDGSSTVEIEVEADDTLESLVSKINSSGAAVKASIVNDGSAETPYRLALSASGSGTLGAMTADLSGNLAFSLSESVAAVDAVVRVGAASERPLLVTSSSNTVTGVVDKVTLDLHSAAPTTTVTVSITQDTSAITSAVSGVVDLFNQVFAKINEYTAFDTTTMKGEVLQGDNVVLSAERRLQSLLTQSFSGTGSNYTSLSKLGIRFESDGTLSFDTEAFQKVLASDSGSVEKLFMDTTNGFLAKSSTLVNSLAQSATGSLSIYADQLQDQYDLYTKRIESMDKLLEDKRARLELSFANMETAIASLQTQESALSSLADLAESLRSSNKD